MFVMFNAPRLRARGPFAERLYRRREFHAFAVFLDIVCPGYFRAISYIRADIVASALETARAKLRHICIYVGIAYSELVCMIENHR
jgi:hypothetical protein